MKVAWPADQRNAFIGMGLIGFGTFLLGVTMGFVLGLQAGNASPFWAFPAFLVTGSSLAIGAHYVNRVPARRKADQT